MNKKETVRNYFPVLTGIRAVAAYMVFLHHANQSNQLRLPVFIYRLLMEFHTGVAVFFVLSGFLIAYRYMDGFSFKPQWFKQYFVNRAARIYPMFLILTVFTFITSGYGLGESNNIIVILTNLFLVKGFFNDLKFSGIAQGWSLTVEECFYFLAPFFFLLYRKKFKLFLLPVLFLMIGFLVVQIFRNNPWQGFMQTNPFMLFYTFFGRSFEFFAGIWLALWLKKNDPAKSNKMPKYKTTTGIILAALSLFAMVYIASSQNIKISIYSYSGLFVNNIILPLGIALFFSGLLTEQSIVKRFLQTRLMQLLGKSSYIFYLIHLGVINTWLFSFISTGNGYMNLVVDFVALNIISIVLFRILEEPLNRSIRYAFTTPKFKAAL